MLELRNVSKDFKDFKLRNISLDVERGEYFVILGPTGAGKTLLLELIAGFHIPDEGKILIDGADATKLPPERRNIGFVYQDYALFPHLSVEENVKFGLRLKNLPKSEIEARVKELMELFGISHLAKRRPRTLSGGEQQKVALARALAVRPRILLLDEPLSALDVPTQNALRVELKKLHRHFGTTTLHVTHDRAEALTLADRIAVMMRGSISQIGKPHEVFRKPANEEVAAFVGVENVLSGRIIGSGGGVARIDVGSFELLAVTPVKSGKVSVFIRPEDIVLSTAPPTPKSSARNCITSRIVSVTDLGALRRVELDCGLVALVTEQAAEELELRAEKEVFATFKATAVHVLPKL